MVHTHDHDILAPHLIHDAPRKRRDQGQSLHLSDVYPPSSTYGNNISSGTRNRPEHRVKPLGIASSPGPSLTLPLSPDERSFDQTAKNGAPRLESDARASLLGCRQGQHFSSPCRLSRSLFPRFCASGADGLIERCLGFRYQQASGWPSGTASASQQSKLRHVPDACIPEIGRAHV